MVCPPSEATLELEEGLGERGSHSSRPGCGLERQGGFLEERVRFLKTQMGSFDPRPKEVIWGAHGGVCTPVGGGETQENI